MPETEIKFRLRESALKAARSAFAADQPSLLETTYFDTPDLKLRQHGVQLRIRRDGKKLIQTVKRANGENGPLTRQEEEIVLSSFAPDLDHLRLNLPAEIRRSIGAAMLRQQFMTRFERRRHLVRRGPTLAEAAFDLGEIVAGSARAPICELEVELKDGSIDGLAGVSLDLLDQVPASLQTEGKAARGYRLAAGALPGAVFSAKLRMAPVMALPDAIRSLLRHNLAHAMENVAAVTASGVPDAVHQLRVGVRRLRSTVTAFRPALDMSRGRSLFKALKTLFGPLGEVRAVDVFIAETLPALEKAGLDEAPTAALSAAAATHRLKALAAARGKIETTEAARHLVKLAAWIEGQSWLVSATPLDQLLERRRVGDFARPRLLHLHEKVVKKGRTARHGNLDDWHQLRIATKKLRYTADPLLASIDAPAEETDAYAQRISRLQEALGRLNDLNGLEAMLGRMLADAEAQETSALAEARRFTARWVGAATAERLATAGTAFQQFKQCGFPGA